MVDLYVAAIDTGSSDTRVVIFKQGTVVATAAEHVGVRDVALSGNNLKLIQAISKALDTAVANADLKKVDLDIVLAAGMITSNLGLCEVPHCEAPVDIERLAKNMQCRKISEICDCPIWFIPGIKNKMISTDKHGVFSCNMDFMRGEEVEVFALMDRLNVSEDTVFVLPGSHCKIVFTDTDKKTKRHTITSSTTTLSGELLETLTKNTILSDSLGRNYINTVDKEMLLEGSHCAEQYGNSRAFFAVRVLEREYKLTKNQLANFLLGAVIYSDIVALREALSEKSRVIVAAGRANIASAYTIVGSQYSLDMEAPDKKMTDHASGYGAMLIAHARGLI